MAQQTSGKSNVKSRKIVYANNSMKKTPKKHFWRNNFVEFCKRTDLHGYKYIVMEEFNYVERCCWALAVVTSIFAAIYFVVTAYKWYARNPIVTIIESTQGAIWDVPFPAITICDLNIVSKKAARTLANNLTLPDNVTADFVFEAFRLVPLLFSTFTATDEEQADLQILQGVIDYNNMTVETLFQTLSPASTCSNLVQRCMWKNVVYRCDEIFQQIFTLLSICCTFNYFAVMDPITDNDELYVQTPRRVASCGYQTALTVLLYTDPEDYYSAMIASQGALVIIDNSYNIPDLDSPVRMVNPSTELLIALSPERTYTTAGIRSFSPDQRQCYYSDEVQIGKFRQYSFHNCMAYEKVLWIKKVCNCMPLSFPGEAEYRTCNFYDMDCMARVYNHDFGNHTDERHNFKCYPECEHYDYPLEVALGNLADNIYVNGLPFFDDVSIKNRSLLNVFFNDLVSTRYRRDVYLNWQNILAAFGGLLSLMLGFTLISGFDLVMFFTVRVLYNSVVSRNKMKNRIYVNEYPNKNNWVDNTVSKSVHQKSITLENYRNHYFEKSTYY
ncbi:sodium channel protein Nach [Helicoverpa armigera]|uniref:sodium channel protein Nach n=1 Tax=Helicoverpa armigera TaxID=29058 RepID=UPI00308396B7